MPAPPSPRSSGGSWNVSRHCSRRGDVYSCSGLGRLRAVFAFDAIDQAGLHEPLTGLQRGDIEPSIGPARRHTVIDETASETVDHRRDNRRLAEKADDRPIGAWVEDDVIVDMVLMGRGNAGHGPILQG